MINMYSLMVAAVASTPNNASVAQASNPNVMFLVMFTILILIYFFMTRSQKKKDKETEELRANIDVGDEVVTIGGIIGTVVSLKDDFIVIETSGDRNKIRITRWAVHANNTASERKSEKATEVSKTKQYKKTAK